MPIQVQSPIGYKLQPQVFQPIPPSSYFHHELPAAPTPKLDKVAKAQAFGAMMKVLGELPGHMTDEYQKGRQRGLQSTLGDRYLTALKTGNTQDLAGFQVLPNGTIGYDPVKAVEVDAKRTEAALNRAKLGRLQNPFGGLTVLPAPSGQPAPSTPARPAGGNAPVEPPLPKPDPSGAPTPANNALQPLDLPAMPDAPATPPAPRAGTPALRTSDASSTPGGDQQLAAFVAPAAVVDTSAGPVTTQTAPPLMAFHPGAPDDAAPPDAAPFTAAGAPPAVTPAVPDDQRQAIAGAAGLASNQLAGVDPQFLSASNADNVPPAPIAPVSQDAALAANSEPNAADLNTAPGAEPEVRRALPVNPEVRRATAVQPPATQLNGPYYNPATRQAEHYVNGVLTRIGIADNMSGDIKWSEAPKKGEGFDTPEDAMAYAKAHGITSQSMTQGQGGKWYLGASVPDELAGYKRGTPAYTLIQHGIDPKGLSPAQQTQALSAINDPVQPETRKELARIRQGDTDPETGLKLSETAAQALIQKNLDATGALTDDQLKHVTQIREKYAALPIYRNAQNVIDGYNNAKLAAQNNSGISDKTMIEEGQRVLNPGSGVRAQTIKMFGGSSGLLERLDPSYILSHFEKGRLLTDAQRKEYLNILDRAYKDRMADMERFSDQHTKMATIARVPNDTAKMYFDNPYKDSIPAETQTATPEQTWKPGQAGVPAPAAAAPAPTAGANAAPAATSSPAQAGTVMMTKGSVTWPIPKDKVDEFQAKGWAPAQ